MIKEKVRIKRPGIITSYVMAIVLPCLILGFLAVRGIRNDQALVEREQRSNLLETGQQIIRETDETIREVERRFSDSTDMIAFPAETIFTSTVLENFCDSNPVIAGIFYLPYNDHPYMLKHNLQYLPDDFSSPVDLLRTTTAGDMLEKGWQMEFREKDYGKALGYYQKALRNVSSRQSRGEILNIIARLQKKQNLVDDAVATYDLIWKEYPDVFIQNSIPLGAVALREKSHLAMEKGDTVTALNTLCLMTAQLEKPAWELSFSHFSNFLSFADESVTAVTKQNRAGYVPITDTIAVLRDRIAASLKHTEYLVGFLQNGQATDEGTSRGAVNHRYKTSIRGKPYLISLVPVNDHGNWGLLIDEDFLLRESLYPSMFNSQGTSGIPWKITGQNGELLLKSETVPEDVQPLQLMFPPELPSWSLTLYPEYSGLLASLFRPGAGVFLYIFIAIVLILSFGLFFTLRTVRNELHLSRMKSYFMSTVSHEFKSPLTSIRQMAEMLVHGRVPAPEKQHKYHMTILEQSERLSHLIDNILDFSRMEEGRKAFHFERADITPVVENIVESFRDQTSMKGFVFNLSVPEPLPEIVFDREAMEQVLYNLLDNACKYSGDSRTIEVLLSSKGGNVLIAVRDHGIGIRKEDCDKIFSRFYRAGEELTQSVKGSGIGLTLVRQIVEAHNGTADVESAVGKGSIFTVTVPSDAKYGPQAGVAE